MNKPNKVSSLRFKRLLSPCLAALAAWVLLAPAAQATPYIVKLTEQGNNVVARGIGAFDLTGLGSCNAGSGSSNELGPNGPNIFVGFTGLTSNGELCPGLGGAASFGTGTPTYSSVGSGAPVGLDNAQYLFVPLGYMSGTSLSSSATWDNASFTSLGVTQGIYVWKWGAGTGDQTFTLEIGNVASVPEPAELGLFGCGLLLVGAFVGLRQKQRPS